MDLMDQIKPIKGRNGQLDEDVSCQEYETVTAKVSPIAREWENTQMDPHTQMHV